jgi:hypothetical protein
LCATATPAPNDFIEFGTHSEFLGIMSQTDMLVRWFLNDTANTGTWRLKGHAVTDFWDWMASWAIMAENPEDLGFDGSRFVLPPMEVIRHRAVGDVRAPAGSLFIEEVSATNMFALKRQTASARAQFAASLVKDGDDLWKNENGQRKLKSSVRDLTLSAEQIMPPEGNTEILPDRPTINTDPFHLRQQNNNSDINLGLDGKITKPCSSTKMGPAPFVEPENQEATESFTSIIAMKPGKSEGFSVTDAMLPSDFSKKTKKTSPALSTIYKDGRTPAWVLWCDTNEEQKMLEKEMGDLAISISGEMTADKKEELHAAWLRGDRPALITKASIFGFGVNWQHCSRMAFVGRTFSYESWYQAVRRCWRFGQKRPVTVHLIVAEGEDQIGRVIDRKAEDHAKMKDAMRAASRRNMGRESIVKVPYNPTYTGRMPTWLRSVA